MLKLFQPAWLLFLIPLWAFFRSWKMPTRSLRAIRVVLVLLLLLSLSGVGLQLPDTTGQVVIIADRSRSMAANAEATSKEVIQLVQKAKPDGCRLSVVSFGEKAALESVGDGRADFGGFTTEVGGEASNLADALQLGISLLPRGSSGRILLLSDGTWTGRDPSIEAYNAKAESLPIDYRDLGRGSAGDLSIAELSLPESTAPGESFMISAWIHSSTSQKVEIELVRGKTTLERQTRSVGSGFTRVMFRDYLQDPGNYRYFLRVRGEIGDPVPENNLAKGILPCLGEKPAMFVSGVKGSGLKNLLLQGGLKLTAMDPGEIDWSLESLVNFSALIIENLPAEKIGVHGMRNVSVWIKETGAGMMMTGGKSAYGCGGYFKSPLERVMPVSMELRTEHRKLSLAIAVVLDRSGSMALPVAGGKKKIDLADLAAVEVVNFLGPLDEFCLFAVDSQAHLVVPLTSGEAAQAARAKILSIESMGGGIFVYEGLKSALQELSKAKAETRHIILFSDANDSEEPGEYVALLEDAAKAKITVSVVGLGTERDQDARLLVDIAKRGNGRIFFTDDATELPRLFAQDTFVVSRSTFIEEPTKFSISPVLSTLTEKSFRFTEDVGGYNLCYIRPGAYLAAVTEDQYHAPLIGAWNAGMGKVLCYTGEADGKFAGAIGKNKEIGSFFASLARWIVGNKGSLPGNSLLTQTMKNGACLVELHLDPERGRDPFQKVPRLSLLKSRAGGEFASEAVELSWKTVDTLAAEIPLRGEETIINTLNWDGSAAVTLSPICLPYAAEFNPRFQKTDAAGMEKLAKISGGKERLNPTDIWNELPRQVRYVNITPFLLLFCLALFLLEILERRIHILGTIRWPSWPHPRAHEEKESVPSRKKSGAGKPDSVMPPAGIPDPRKTPAPLRPEDQPPEPKTAPPTPPKSDTMQDALSKARDRAKRRTDKS